MVRQLGVKHKKAQLMIRFLVKAVSLTEGKKMDKDQRRARREVPGAGLHPVSIPKKVWTLDCKLHKGRNKLVFPLFE